MGDDVVHIPACFVQCFSCGPVFVLTGQFLFPPGSVVDSVESPRGVELPKLSLIVWIVRLQNAVPNVVTAGPAHGKDFLPADLVELPSHQVQDAGTDRLHQTAMPLTCWVTSEQIIVFVIPTDEQGGKCPVLQPVEPLLFNLAAIPDAAKVSVIPNSGQQRLYRVNFYTEKFQNPVNKQILHKIFRYSIFNPVYRGLALHSCFSRVSQCLR